MSEAIGETDDQVKPTEYGETPEGWTTIQLKELAENQDDSFVDGPFGSNLKSSEFVDEGYARVIQLQNIRSGEFIDTNHKYVTEEKFHELERHATYPGDIAIAKMSDPVARACIVPDLEKRYVVVADCIKLSVNESKAVPQYVMLALNSHPVWRQAYVRSRGSTRKRINLTQLKEVEIPYPPLPEQRRIADILSTVDEQIQQTDEKIEKTKELKRGLMQDLLTKGIGHNDYEERYLGPRRLEIPQKWNKARLEEVSQIITRGKQPTYVEEGGGGSPYSTSRVSTGMDSTQKG